jgi:hypothetical protein
MTNLCLEIVLEISVKPLFKVTYQRQILKN